MAQRIPRAAALWVAAAAALPRLAVLAIERGTILERYVEKSDRFATTLVDSGTFGFLPGVPSAYTQPLYAWFLAGIYWPFGRSWLAVGLAQMLLAVVTALIVLAIGARLHSTRVGVIAALVTTLHPYVIWHDMHINRELVDGLLLAAITLTALIAYERRSPRYAIATGALIGLAILGNSRLLLLPAVLAPYVVWRIRPGRRSVVVGICVFVAALIVVAPWASRNKITIGCVSVTTDARALWKANNPRTYGVLAAGGWIDDVPDLPGIPPWPEKAAEIAIATGRPVRVDECAQMAFYQDEVIRFWKEHPAEKARLARQATTMLWSPLLSVEADDPGQQGLADLAQNTVEPVFVVVLFALAIFGAFLCPRRYLTLAAVMLSYNTVMAMVFAGTSRYRTPWDFLLAVLAAFALEWIWSAVRARHAPVSAPS